MNSSHDNSIVSIVLVAMADASSSASSSSAASKGVILDNEELQRFIHRSKAQNTVKKTRSGLNVWY